MQTKFRKIAASGIGLLTAGATLAAGFAGVAFGNDLSDFAAGDVFTTQNTIIVVGQDADMSDNIGAINIGAKLAQSGATYTGSTAAQTAPGVVALDTATTRIYGGDAINTAKETLTKDDLSTLLASSKMTDNDDKNYDIDQYIELGKEANLSFTKHGDDDSDPTLKIKFAGSNQPLYTLKATFDTINMTKAKGEKLTLFGKEYTVSSDTNTDKLCLYSGATTIQLNRDETQTITIGGVDYAVKLKAVTSGTPDKATIEVNGVTDEVNEKKSKKINGINIYADTISTYQSVVGGVALNTGEARLLIGSQKLIFDKDGGEVVLDDGTEENDIEGTEVVMDAPNALSSLQIKVYGDDEEDQVVELGKTFTDPVFGTFKFVFDSVTPALDDERITTTKITRASKEGKVTFTDRKGVEKTITFAYGKDEVSAKLEYNDGKKISTYEGEDLVENDYVVVGDTQDNTHLFKISDIKSDGTKVKLNDIYSGTNYDVDLSSATGTKTIDGKTYTFTVDGDTNTTLQITYSETGTKMVFPKLVGKNGEAISFVDETPAIDLSGITTVKLPSGDLTVAITDDQWINFTNAASTTISLNNEQQFDTITVGKVKYNISISDLAANKTTMKVEEAGDSPAVLFMSYDKNVNKESTDLIHYVIAVDRDGDKDMEVEKPEHDAEGNGINFEDLESDDDKSKFVDRYGTTILYDKTDKSSYIEITYPPAQVYANLYLMEIAAAAPTATGTQNIEHLGLTTEGIARLANDESITSDKTTKNVILVGGPAINSLVEELATAGKTPDVTYYRDETKEGSLNGKALIQYIPDAFKEGYVAIVVSGYEADQTRAASLKFATEELTGTAIVLEGTETAAYDFEAYKAANEAAEKNPPAGNDTIG